MMNTRLVLLVLLAVLGVAWAGRSTGGWKPPQGNGPYNPNPSRPRYRRYVVDNHQEVHEPDHYTLYEEVQRERRETPTDTITRWEVPLYRAD